MFKPFPLNSRVASICGARGRVTDRTVIGGNEYYLIQTGSDRRDQIARLHHELTREA